MSYTSIWIMHFQERPISLLVYLHDSVIVSCAIKVPQTTWHTVVSKKPANPEKYFPYVHSPAALPGAPASVLWVTPNFGPTLHSGQRNLVIWTSNQINLWGDILILLLSNFVFQSLILVIWWLWWRLCGEPNVPESHAGLSANSASTQWGHTHSDTTDRTSFKGKAQ